MGEAESKLKATFGARYPIQVQTIGQAVPPATQLVSKDSVWRLVNTAEHRLGPSSALVYLKETIPPQNWELAVPMGGDRLVGVSRY